MAVFLSPVEHILRARGELLKINKKEKEQIFIYIWEVLNWAKAFVSQNYILLFIKESRVILSTWHDHCFKVHPTCLITLTFIMALASLFRDRSLLCLINLFALMPFPFVENPTVVAIQGCRYLGCKDRWQLPGTHSLRKQEHKAVAAAASPPADESYNSPRASLIQF